MKNFLVVSSTALFFTTSSVFAGGSSESIDGGRGAINYYEWDVPNMQFVEDFMAEHPNTQVEVHTITANGDRATKLDIMAMSGSDINVMPIADGDHFIE